MELFSTFQSSITPPSGKCSMLILPVISSSLRLLGQQSALQITSYLNLKQNLLAKYNREPLVVCTNCAEWLC